jgi:hypothetical protein
MYQHSTSVDSLRSKETEEMYQHSTSVDSLRSKETEEMYQHSTSDNCQIHFRKMHSIIMLLLPYFI